MTEFVDVVEINPVVFVNKIVEHIADGFYVQNTLAGYPSTGLPYYAIRLFKTEAPTVRNTLDSEVHTAVVEGYDIMRWLLDVQDVALQGFDMAVTGASVDNYKSVTMTKRKPMTFDLGTPVEKLTEPSKPKRTATKAKTKPTEGETE